MCADAQTANLLSRKLIRSRSLDESLSTPETNHLLLVPFVLAKDGNSKCSEVIYAAFHNRLFSRHKSEGRADSKGCSRREIGRQ